MINYLSKFFQKKSIAPNYEITYGGAMGVDAFLLDNVSELRRDIYFSIARKAIKEAKKQNEENIEALGTIIIFLGMSFLIGISI